MEDQDLLTPVVRKILQTLKLWESTSTVVTKEYVEKLDPAFKERYLSFDSEKELHIDLNLISLGKIEDMYRDQTVFY